MHRICVGISFFLLAGLTGPTPASAQTITDSVALFWGPAAAAVLLAVAALVLWSQARARDRAIAALRAEIDQLNTVSTAAAEQAVFWKNSTDQGRATPGFEALLGEEISDNAPFEAVLALLSSGDAEALRAAVDSLRRDRAEFQFQCGMADGVRHFAFRGVCAAGGLSMVYVRDRTASAGSLSRLSTEARRLHGLLNGLKMPAWVRDADLRLSYVNQAYRDALELTDDAPAASLSAI